VLEGALEIRYGNEIAAVFHQGKKLLQFLFGTLPLGDVLRYHEYGGASGIFHGVQKNLHVNDRSVLSAVTPLPDRLHMGRTVVKCPEQSGDFFWRVEVADAHPLKLYPFIPIMKKCCVIDLEKLQAFPLKHPHGERILSK